MYAGIEGFKSLNVKNKKDDLSIKGDVVMEGSSNELRDFTLDVLEGEGNRHSRSTHPSYKDKLLNRSIVTSL